jgi:RHS repeat-associated protein
MGAVFGATVGANTNIAYRFTGKDLETETGLYYYGARYLDPKTSRWLSADPAVGDYLPGAPVSDEARRRNGSLPGMGGVYNYVNLHVYHYAGNNPVKYIDPDGRAAGDEFDSLDAAAFDFAYTYNDDSIATGREYGSTIYSYQTSNGSTKYSYTVPNQGTKENSQGQQGVNVSVPAEGQIAIATIHTHGNLDSIDAIEQDTVNYNSIGDQRRAKLPSYVVGPSGVLSVFDPSTMIPNSGRIGESPNARLLTTPENNNIPKDGSDTYNPRNNNIVDRKNYHKDPSISRFSQFISNFKFW